MVNILPTIKNCKKTIDFFGYWPKFCDAKILSFIFDKTKERIFSIQLRIYYIDADQNKNALIDILFNNVSNLDINNIFTENVLDELVINKDQNTVSSYKVELISCYGANGVFVCEEIEVVAMIPNKGVPI
jgi:hypothetical protein